MDNYNHNNSQYPTPYSPPIPVKKRHTGAIVALCLVFFLLIGSIGVMGGYLLGNNMLNPQVGATLTPTGSETNTPNTNTGETPKPISTTPVVTSNILSIQEIFAIGDAQTVAIATQITVNAYGQRVTQASAGSGFILSSDGYILTNYHVIEDANEITIMLNNGDEYPATLTGGDSQTDIAVLKIDASGLSAVTIGNSDSITVGDQVVAIGNPLGELANSLTVGYISAKERVVTIDEYPRSMIQTDASVSPGNSGGPLFNNRGEVIGVVSAKSVSTGVEGIGFAIPINQVMDIATDLIDHGYVTGRPYIGIGYSEISRQAANYLRLPEGVYGIYVENVEKDAAAEKAGIQKGDVIIKLNDDQINSGSDMVKAKLKYNAGDTVSITVYRNGEEVTLSLTFGTEKPVNTPIQ